MDKYTIEKQAVSLDLAKELKANGYPCDGVFRWVNIHDKWTIWYYKEHYLHLEMERERALRDEEPEYCVAPTVAELGERLPALLDEEGGHWHLKLIKRCNTAVPWLIRYNCCESDNDLKIIETDTEANARAKMWLYLKKENLL